MTQGKVWLVGAGPGESDLITLRGYRALQQADVVLYDALVDASLLDELDCQLIYVGKRCGRHAVSQEEICSMLVELGWRGDKVVRLKGGDPTVFGRGGEEAMALVEAGIPFEVVPGVSSAVSVPISAGIPVTHRGVAEGFTVVTAHRRNDASGFAFPDHDDNRTLVLLMGVKTAAIWSTQLLEMGYPSALPVAFVSRGWSAEQQVSITRLDQVAAHVEDGAVASPAIAVLGRVVNLRPRLRGIVREAIAAQG